MCNTIMIRYEQRCMGTSGSMDRYIQNTTTLSKHTMEHPLIENIFDFFKLNRRSIFYGQNCQNRFVGAMHVYHVNCKFVRFINRPKKLLKLQNSIKTWIAIFQSDCKPQTWLESLNHRINSLIQVVISCQSSLYDTQIQVTHFTDFTGCISVTLIRLYESESASRINCGYISK